MQVFQFISDTYFNTLTQTSETRNIKIFYKQVENLNSLNSTGRKISISRKQPKTVIGRDCGDCHQSVFLALPELLKKSMELEACRGNTVLTRL